MKKLLYEALQFFATWLKQPTLIEVAEQIEIKQAGNRQ
jgi:hypothetical protein